MAVERKRRATSQTGSAVSSTEGPSAALSGRRHPRVPLHLLVQVRTSSIEEFKSMHGVNLSIGGVFVKTTDRRPVGSQVFFQFTLRGGGTLIEGLAKVVHVNDEGMGMEFVSVLEPSAGIIRALVAQRLSETTIPQR